MDPYVIRNMIDFSDKAPSEPGLYILVETDNVEHVRDEEYVNSHLVDIREHQGTLLADSDSWYTFLPLSTVFREFPGVWSKRIYFK